MEDEASGAMQGVDADGEVQENMKDTLRIFKTYVSNLEGI